MKIKIKCKSKFTQKSNLYFWNKNVTKKQRIFTQNLIEKQIIWLKYKLKVKTKITIKLYKTKYKWKWNEKLIEKQNKNTNKIENKVMIKM